MELKEIIGLIASLISIVSAIWAAVNVRVIKKTKRDIFSKLKIEKYSEIVTSSQGTISQLRKIANKNKIPPGVNFSDIIDSLNKFYENLNTIKCEIITDGYVNLELQMNELKQKVQVVQNMNRSTPNIISSFTEIYYLVIDIDGEVSKYKKQIIEK